MISPAGAEGLTLISTRQVHIMEPYWNQSRLDQVIGRAIRYCSHKDLPEEDKPDMTSLMADHMAAIDASTDEDSLKKAYQAAYKACGTDANWQKKIIAVKDEKKASLK